MQHRRGKPCRGVVVVVLAWALVACGESHDPGLVTDAGGTERDARAARPDGGDGMERPDADVGPGELAPGTYTLTAGPFTTAPTEEETQCVKLDLGNEGPAMLREVRTSLSPGSHHMIVYRLDEPADPTPRPCGAFAHGEGDSFFIAQQAEAGLRYPEGTGLKLEAHQTIGIEVHYINYFSEEDEDISGRVELDLVPVDEGIEEVKLLFTGELALHIPARSMGTTVESFHEVPAGARVFALTSHTHRLGVKATLHRARSEDEAGELLHESTTWSEPPLDTFEPPLEFEAGEGLLLTCRYDNPTPDPVNFGTGFEDEMCFLWAHYIE